MKFEKRETVWLIMSKDRKLVAKGTPRNRSLVDVKTEDSQRYLTYSTEGRARAGFRMSGFYGQDALPGYDYEGDLSQWLEPVKVEMIIREVQ